MNEQETKKCTECLADIPKKAKKCSQCGSKQKAASIVLGTKMNLILLFLLLIFLGAWLGIVVWYISIPIVAIWYIWKKSKIETRKKQIASALLILSAIVLLVIDSNSKGAPVITVETPENNTSVQAESITVKGEVEPKNSILSINGSSITLNDGSFVSEVTLGKEINNIQIVAKNPRSNNQDSVILSIHRIFTDEELADIEREKAQAEVRRAEMEANRKAEQEREEAEWKASKPGQICTQHPLWAKEDCIRLADRKIWVGMDYDMLTYLRGLPDNANPSNYGSGTQWQWCWMDYTPSCFYDNNNDGLIDSYN